MVSVIIPTYNRGWIVKEAVDSVLNQTCKACELIAVDDGSTDNTASILNRFGDKLRIVRQENKGVSAARNKGIEVSSGNLIALLDSDDLWLPQKLERQISFFQMNPGALICQTQELWIRNGRRVNPGKRHKKLSGMIFEPSLNLCLISPSAVMFRRELLDRVGWFDENLPACEDYDLWLRVASRYPVYLIDEYLTVKRGGHHDQLSRSPMLDRYRIEALKKILHGSILTEKQRQAAISKLKEKCLIYAAGCKKRNRFDEARHYYQMIDSMENDASHSPG